MLAGLRDLSGADSRNCPARNSCRILCHDQSLSESFLQLQLTNELDTLFFNQQMGTQITGLMALAAREPVRRLEHSGQVVDVFMKDSGNGRMHDAQLVHSLPTSTSSTYTETRTIDIFSR